MTSTTNTAPPASPVPSSMRVSSRGRISEFVSSTPRRRTSQALLQSRAAVASTSGGRCQPSAWRVAVPLSRVVREVWVWS